MKIKINRQNLWVRATLRTLRHFILFNVGTGLITIFARLSHRTGDDQFMNLPPDSMVSISIASAYTSITFLLATLLIGPIQLMRSKALPLSSYLRRDLGIWTGIFALTHFYTSLEIDFGPNTSWLYLFLAENPDALIPFRLDLFGISNYLGLIAIILFSVVLAISSDFALKALKPARWKGMQRWVYAAAGLTFIHGIIYQVIAERSVIYVATFAVIFLAIFAAQARGYQAKQKRLKQAGTKAPSSL